jgi:hypothetical protein
VAVLLDVAVLLPVVVLVDVAAVAIAAPPPTRAPVKARLISAGFSLGIGLHLLGSMKTTIRPVCRTPVGER